MSAARASRPARRAKPGRRSAERAATALPFPTPARTASSVHSRTRTLADIGLTEFPLSYTVLLVEDDELVRMNFRRYLTHNSHQNCHVVEFSNAEDALVWCRDHTPDIALSDYRLPGMNGLEFVTALRQQASHEDIPCIKC